MDVGESIFCFSQRPYELSDNHCAFFQKMPSLTLTDLLKFAQENISNKPYKYLILGDEKNLDLKSLEKIAPIRRVSTKEIFGF